MKIKRYQAREMRLALRQIRDELGANAVILSSRRLASGVEVTVAVDYEDVPSATAVGCAGPLTSARANVPAPGAHSVVPSTTAVAENAMEAELRRLRRMLETQLAQLAWNDLARRSPLQLEVQRELLEMGFTTEIAAQYAADLPADVDLACARRLVQARLGDALKVTGDRWLEYGGVLALTGCTGVGKSATVAKLAARWVLRHGARSLALISTDNLRPGAHEQLLRLGRLLGAPTYALDELQDLAPLLASLSDRRLILIDTAGLSQKDPRWPVALSALRSAHEHLELALVIAANAQAGSIEEALSRCGASRPTSCVLTKLDDAISLGGTASSLIRSALPVSYLSDGARVPEDLRPARNNDLITLAVGLARGGSAEDSVDSIVAAIQSTGEVRHVCA